VGRGVAGVGDGIGECPPFFDEIGEGQFVSTQSFSLSSASFLSSRISLPCPSMSFQARDAGFISWTDISFKHQMPSKTPNRSFKHVPHSCPL